MCMIVCMPVIKAIVTRHGSFHEINSRYLDDCDHAKSKTRESHDMNDMESMILCVHGSNYVRQYIIRRMKARAKLRRRHEINSRYLDDYYHASY